MLIDNKLIDTKNFMEKFYDKFTNVCVKIPIYVSFNVVKDKVIIDNLNDDENNKATCDFVFDFSKKVEDNIFEIRDYMKRNWFPKFTSVIEYEDGKGEITCIIDKVLENGNLILDQKGNGVNRSFLYKLKVPWIKMRECYIESPDHFGEYFFQNAEFLKVLKRKK